MGDWVPRAERARWSSADAAALAANMSVGFWSPDYARAFEVPGHHLHFLTDDAAAGGHLLGCVAAGALELDVQALHDLRVALPENEAFLRADLSRDPAAALASAERAKPDPPSGDGGS